MADATVTELPDYPRGLTFEQVWASIKELRESQKETERLVKETSRQMGLLNNSFGELAEHLVAPGIMDKFNDLGFNFTRCGKDVKIKEPGNPRTIAEIDILLENGDIVIAVEVKAKPKVKDIEEHIERMEKLLRSANKKYDNRVYRGAIAGAIMGEDVRRSCLENGFYVIEQAGDTMKIDIPPGFVPREWKLDITP
jgi:hypothetical protein